MDIQDHPAVRHFGGVPQLAKALNITRQAITMRISSGRPLLKRVEALALQTLTDGALRADVLLESQEGAQEPTDNPT